MPLRPIDFLFNKDFFLHGSLIWAAVLLTIYMLIIYRIVLDSLYECVGVERNMPTETFTNLYPGRRVGAAIEVDSAIEEYDLSWLMDD